MGLIEDFALQAGAGLIGVFAGVLLALWVERRRQRIHEQREREREQVRVTDARNLILMSVVKNTSEAKRLAIGLQEDKDPYHFGIAFETAVWEATQATFVQFSALDERVQFSRYFDRVRHLLRLLEFHRQVRAQHEVTQSPADAGDRALFAGIVDRLRVVAQDVRLEGVLLVTDHGGVAHKRLLGLDVAEPAAP